MGGSIPKGEKEVERAYVGNLGGDATMETPSMVATMREGINTSQVRETTMTVSE